MSKSWKMYLTIAVVAVIAIFVAKRLPVIGAQI